MTIKTNGKGMKRTLLGLILLGTIFVDLGITAIAADTTYEVALNKGTETFIVNQYNEEKWEDTVDDELEPDDWFKGDSDVIGAKSKITVRNVDDYNWDMFEVLISIFDVMSIIPDDLSVNDSLILMAYFSEDSIDDLFPGKYEVWEALTIKWVYETEEFDEVPDETENMVPIFKDPEDFKDILENYNIWATAINSTMISLGLQPYPILDGDEFVWQLIISGLFTIPRPFNNYLTTVIDELDCDDIEVKKNALIIDKEGEEDYTVEVIFNDQGIQAAIIVKTADDRIIYEIVNDNTEILVLVATGIALVIILTGIIYITIRKRNLNK